MQSLSSYGLGASLTPWLSCCSLALFIAPAHCSHLDFCRRAVSSWSPLPSTWTDVTRTLPPLPPSSSCFHQVRSDFLSLSQRHCTSSPKHMHCWPQCGLSYKFTPCTLSSPLFPACTQALTLCLLSSSWLMPTPSMLTPSVWVKGRGPRHQSSLRQHSRQADGWCCR